MDNHNLNDIPYELIISDLEGTISEPDRRKIRDWRLLSKENEDIYNNISLVFHEIELLPEYQKLDTDTSWRSFREKLEKASQKTVVDEAKIKSNNVRNLKLYISIAASLLLIMWFSVRFFRPDDTIRIATGASQHKKIIMPDGSEIMLNEKTEISYHQRSYRQDRVINLLNGEAYFSVTHSDNYPFRINVSHFEIRDIGTTFNVKYLDKSIYVTVSSGVVSLANKQNQEAVTLTANQKGICNISSSKIVSFKNDEMNYKAWADHNFQFIDYPMSEIIKKLSDVYGVRIVLEDSTLGNKKLTLSFQNQNIDSVMSIISQAMQVKMGKKGGVFYLKDGSY